VFIFYTLIFIAIAAASVVAFKSGLHLTVWAAAALAAILIPLPTYAVVMAVAKSDKQTYHEYYNGYEVAANTSVTSCTRDGSCSNEYNCDPYTVHYTERVKNSSGDGYHEEDRTRTEYHRCPYSTEETTYTVDTTLGGYTIAANQMTGPEWRSRQIPGGRVTTPPKLWSDAKARIDAGTPGGTTQVNSYKNYILASENTVLKRYSDKIDDLKEKGLLPPIASGTQDFYKASKASFAGDVLGIDKNAITNSLSDLNGAVGTELRGDVRLVFVDGDAVGSTEDYGNALIAYWQSPEAGRDALPKNTIVVIVGVEKHKSSSTDTTQTEAIKNGTPVVGWAKAYTGMPMGNEALLRQLSGDLEGLPIDKNFVGSPSYNVATETIKHTNGAIESILFGENQFERVSMSAKDADDSGTGFTYLSDEWRPSTGVWVCYFSISAVLFLLFAVGGTFAVANITTGSLRDPVRHFTETIFTKTNRKN